MVECKNLIAKLEKVSFSEVLKKYRVDVYAEDQTSNENLVEELQEVLQKIQSIDLPNHQKYAIIAAIECAEEILTTSFTKVKLTAQEVQNIVQSAWHIKPILEDVNYYTTDKNTLSKFLQSTMSRRLKYIDDAFDCDNFAEYVSSMMSLEYGLNTTGQCDVALFELSTFLFRPIGLHACNMVITADKKALLYEPQLNQFLNGNVLTLKSNDGQEVNILYVPFRVAFY